MLSALLRNLCKTAGCRQAVFRSWYKNAFKCPSMLYIMLHLVYNIILVMSTKYIKIRANYFSHRTAMRLFVSLVQVNSVRSYPP